MKLFGRRLIMKSTPAAVIGASVAMNTVGSSMPSSPPQQPGYPSPFAEHGGLMPNVVSKTMAGAMKQAIYPASYNQYEAARELYQKAQHYKYMCKSVLSDGRHGLDLDIQVLKSVSIQHKAAMQIARNDRERKAEKSFFSNLAESLGLTEFLSKGMETIGGVSTSAEGRSY